MRSQKIESQAQVWMKNGIMGFIYPNKISIYFPGEAENGTDGVRLSDGQRLHARHAGGVRSQRAYQPLERQEDFIYKNFNFLKK